MSKHRELIEMYIKQKLDRSVIVHHIDENPKNNDLNNLAVMTHKDHRILHAHMQRITGNTMRMSDEIVKARQEQGRYSGVHNYNVYRSKYITKN